MIPLLMPFEQCQSNEYCIFYISVLMVLALENWCIGSSAPSLLESCGGGKDKARPLVGVGA